MAQPNPPAFDPKAAPAPTMEQFLALQQELQNLRRTVASSVDAMPDEPFYECAEPFYSSDDVYYPAGARFVDVTGIMTPNENMIPLNDAAAWKVQGYIESLPHQQRTPTLANMAEAMMKVRPKHGDDPKMLAELQSRILREAFDIQYGVGSGDGAPSVPAHAVARPRGNVPLMPNTKIIGGDPSRGRPATRFVADPVAAASKTTRVMGTVQSNPLGTEQQGVNAQ